METVSDVPTVSEGTGGGVEATCTVFVFCNASEVDGLWRAEVGEIVWVVSAGSKVVSAGSRDVTLAVDNDKKVFSVRWYADVQ